jgi:hypothetical protein
VLLRNRASSLMSRYDRAAAYIKLALPCPKLPCYKMVAAAAPPDHSGRSSARRDSDAVDGPSATSPRPVWIARTPGPAGVDRSSTSSRGPPAPPCSPPWRSASSSSAPTPTSLAAAPSPAHAAASSGACSKTSNSCLTGHPAAPTSRRSLASPPRPSLPQPFPRHRLPLPCGALTPALPATAQCASSPYASAAT